MAVQLPAVAASLAEVDGIYQAQGGTHVLGATLSMGLISFVAAALSGVRDYHTHITWEQ